MVDFYWFISTQHGELDILFGGNCRPFSGTSGVKRGAAHGRVRTPLGNFHGI